MTSGSLGEAAMEEARRLGMELDPETAGRMEAHFRLLHRWNRVVGLTAARHPAQAAPMYVEALQVLDQFPASGGLLLDLGTGGGFPGLVLALLRPTWRVVLVERASRKVAFLGEAIRELGLKGVEVLERNLRRMEDLPSSLHPSLLTAKAVGQFRLTLDVLEGRAVPRGRAVLFTGEAGERQVSAELDRRRGRLLLRERRRLAGRERSYALIVELAGAAAGPAP